MGFTGPSSSSLGSSFVSCLSLPRFPRFADGSRSSVGLLDIARKIATAVVRVTIAGAECSLLQPRPESAI